MLLSIRFMSNTPEGLTEYKIPTSNNVDNVHNVIKIPFYELIENMHLPLSASTDVDHTEYG